MNQCFSRLLALILLIFLLPFLIILYFFVTISSRGGFLFKQKRAGKNKSVFILYKIRTMVENAELLKSKLYHLNETDKPVFKIYNDPRYTGIGKFLSHTGLDELPQLINVIKGEMNFVGPRPLPVGEAQQVPKKYQKRFSVLPGITSPWVLQGAHKLSFRSWMESDLDYIENKSIINDSIILGKSFLLVLTFIFRKVFYPYEKP
jgi:lipopolysaccharide/colanic/teichoic acid biosynthesis glycosyltransferase